MSAPTIRQVAEERAKFRAECRRAADEIMAKILEMLDKCPVNIQGHITSMLMTELQIASRQASKDAKETT